MSRRKLELGKEFRTAYNPDKYLIFVSGRLLNKANYEIIIPSPYNTYSKKVIYFFCNIPDNAQIDVYYIESDDNFDTVPFNRDIRIFTKTLYEFPIERININYPKWVEGLNEEHWLKVKLFGEIRTSFESVTRIKEITEGVNGISKTEIIEQTSIEEIMLGTGTITIGINLNEDLFYKVLTEISGVDVSDEGDLFAIITNLAMVKKEYDKLAYALHEVEQKGYGIDTPTMDDLILEEPEMVKQGSRFGVKLRAKAPSIHMIKANIETEVAPIVGSEKQSEELVNYLLAEFENDPKKIWESNIFGKSLHELVNEGLQNKLCRMPEDAQEKLQETLERIVNEGSGGLICIIL